MKTFLRLGWHLVRYTLATCTSTIVSGLVPILVASVPLVLAIVWVLAWAAAFLFYLLTGEAIAVEFEPIGLILVPLLLAVVGAATLSAAVLLTLAFNLLIVLPFSLIMEALYGRLNGQRAGLRLGIFLSGGIVLGVMVATVGVMWVSTQQPETSLSHQVGLAGFLMITCIMTEFAFGVGLSVMDVIQKGLVAIQKEIRRRRVGGKLSKLV